MDEEKEEKKKLGIVKRIFKWIGLGLLIVLIILGLIFQAPWKVITLLLIVLAACTILPKQLRKWFWAGVGAVVIALIVWVFLPQETEGWRPYTFDEELAALEAKRAIPDEENAARIYNELLEIPFLDGNEPEFFTQTRPSAKSGPWRSVNHPEMADWLSKQQVIIHKLMEASKIKKCRFPIDANIVTMGDSLDWVGSMRQWAYLLIAAGNNDLGEGRVDQGLEKYNALLQISSHAYQQATMVEMLVGFAFEALALRQFNRFVVSNDAAEETLVIIEIALERGGYDWSSDFPRVLDHEKLFAKNFWGMFYAINPEGKVRRSRDPYEAMRTRLKEQLEADQVEDKETRELLEESIYLTYWQRKLAKASTLLGWFFLPASPQKAGRIIDESYEKFYAMAEPGFDWQKAPAKSGRRLRINYRYMVEYSTEILAPAYHRVHDIYLRLTADKRGSRIIIALRQYKNQNGFWPVNLDDVKSMAPAEIFVDPHNGGDFVYQITEENFRLYSKGKNGIDEDGERDEEADTDDWLIWPPRTGGCETEEENTDDEPQ